MYVVVHLYDSVRGFCEWNGICSGVVLLYSQTCIKKSPLGQGESDLIRQVAS